jgi:hypothetical protein
MRRFIFLVYIFLAYGHPTAAGELTLDDIPLNWEHFQPKVYSSTDPYMAYVHTNLRYKIVPDKDDDHFLVECETYIDAERSTVNKNFLSYATPVEKQQLLDHEKCHVIIAYICNKKLQLAFARAEFPYDVKTVADSVFSAIMREINSMSTAYDEETAHGRHSVEQERWKNELLSGLNDLYAADELRNVLSVSLAKPPFLKFYAPQEYEYKKVQTAFEDNFDDDRNGWLKGEQADTGILASISNGLITLSSTGKSDGWSWYIKENIDYDRDFEIQFSFKIKTVDGRRKRAGGVYWGASDSSGFTWIAVARGVIELVNCHGGDHKSDTRQYINSYPALKEGIFYKIAIRKVKDKYAVFLNDKFKAELPFEKLPGNRLALGAQSNSAIVFDYLSIYYLD